MAASKPNMPSYTEIFDNIRLVGNLLAADKLDWRTELPVGAPNMPFILHLSCMVHYTPHVPLLALRILRKIGIDCPVLGGPENCCGALHAHLGDNNLCEQTAKIGIAGFRKARPTTVLSLCPDCDETFSQFMPEQKPFFHSNISEIFAERIDELQPLMKPVNRRVVIHSHGSNEQRVRDARNIEAVLRAIPGLVIVNSEKHRGEGPHCQILDPMPPLKQRAMFDEAVALSADSLVVPYHSCYRQHLKLELNWNVSVKHYLTILGESLGIEEDEEYKRLRLLDDVDKAVEALRPRFEPLGYTSEQLRPLVAWSIYC